MNEPTFASVAKPDGAPSGGALVLLLLLGLGVAGLAAVAYPAVWLAEQIALVSGQEFGRAAWLVLVAAHGLGLLLLSLACLALSKSAAIRVAFRLWALAGLFALLMLPVQAVAASQAQLAALLQMAGAAVFLIILAVLRRRRGWPAGRGAAPRAGRFFWPAILAAAAVGWPWVVWGALGSWLDTLLNLGAAALFGLAAARAWEFAALPYDDANGGAPLPFMVAGLVAAVALLTMGAAFGHNGQQLILLFLLFAAGWLVGAARGARRAEIALLLALLVAPPLLFIDPEELALILNLGSRDVGYYALFATLIGLVILFFLGVLGWLLARADLERRRLALAAASALAALALVAAYALAGQPGWHGERLYVILAEQADLSTAAAIADPTERRAAVYEALTQQAEATQGDIRQALERAGIDYRPYYLVNALEVDAGPLARLWLEARPEVDRVLDSPELRPLPETPPPARGSAEAPTEPQWNLVDIGAPQVWADFGARGQGILIGQSDSGVDGSHVELREQYRGYRAGGEPVHEYNWLDLWNGSAAPTDIGGHGTHTLGSALGRSVGVAPDATWIGCVNLGRNLGNAPRYLDCLQFLLAPFPQGGDPLADGRAELGANVLNNSWGCPAIEGCDANALLAAVRALRAAGVFVVASAGNDGDACETVQSPISLYEEVFSVGAADQFGEVAFFSSRGPVTADGSGRTKPDLVAPGVDVLSAYPGDTYDYGSGTSMAGPHVVGVVALLWSAEPALIGDIDATERILTETARPLDPQAADPCDDDGELPDNLGGYGWVDAYAAVARAMGR